MAQILALSPLFERLPAPQKKFREVVVFVHSYGAHRHTFKRHMDWVNELGFDVVTFDLPVPTLSDIRQRLPIGKDWSFGLRHVWADKIEQVLGALAEKKILYTFSSPSGAALMAVARRHAIDVTAWVCDSGPFLNYAGGTEKFIYTEKLLENRPRLLSRIEIVRPVSHLLGWLMGSRNYARDVAVALKSLPVGFPILSARGEQDVLTSSDEIDEFFSAGFGHIDFQRVLLHKSGHLTGLRDEPEIYKQVVGGFLAAKGT